ncbi:hypothetical protein [Gryllotalpicola koreensis]|uniref:Uncharacterized protein n=1 Tax=Gryllotalpicola koreensis TaxID=993086 RepID=A0ABP8A335_9MICO
MTVDEYKQTPEYQAWRRAHSWGAEIWTGQEPNTGISSPAAFPEQAPVKRRKHQKQHKPTLVIPADRQLEIAIAALEERDRRKAAEAAKEVAA